jgi:hypothetical protein
MNTAPRRALPETREALRPSPFSGRRPGRAHVAGVGVIGPRLSTYIIGSMPYTRHPDSELLQAALSGYQHQHTLLGERIAEITRELGGKPRRPDTADVAKPKRGMSDAGRARIAAAQRKRWAELKKATGTPAKKTGRKAKRKMSAAGRARIAEATRKRWAAYRAQKAAGTRRGRRTPRS